MFQSFWSFFVKPCIFEYTVQFEIRGCLRIFLLDKYNICFEQKEEKTNRLCIQRFQIKILLFLDFILIGQNNFNSFEHLCSGNRHVNCTTQWFTVIEENNFTVDIFHEVEEVYFKFSQRVHVNNSGEVYVSDKYRIKCQSFYETCIRKIRTPHILKFIYGR